MIWPLCIGFFRDELSTRCDNVGYGGDVKIDEHFAEEFPLAARQNPYVVQDEQSASIPAGEIWCGGA